MKNENRKHKRNKIMKSNQIDYQTYDQYINIRRKTISLLDSKLKTTFTNLDTLLSKINNVKDIEVFNKYDVNDLKSVKNLDNNALLFSRNIKRELNKSSDLLSAYNLSSIDLDNFINEYKKNKKMKKNTEKKIIIKNENKKNYKSKDSYNKLKKEFDLANTGKNKKDKIMNNLYLKNESKTRDLYNLKLELFFNEQKKKINKNKYFENVQKAPICLRDKDKRISQVYSAIKSRYFDIYKLPQSFELEEEMRDKKIFNEENKIEEETEKNKVNNDDILITRNNGSKYIEENNDNKKIILNNNSDNITNNENNENKENIKIKKNTSSSDILKNKIQNNYSHSMSFNNNSQININTMKNNNSSINIKKGKENRPNSGNIYNRNTYNLNNYKNNTTFKYNYSTKNKKNISISPNISKHTFYSSTTSNRPISAFTSINNNSTIYRLGSKNKNKKIYLNKNINHNTISKYKKKAFFTTYINEINKIIKYSNYTTNKFKKSSNILKNKKLFQKSNSEIFDRTYSVDLGKIKESLKLDKNRHSFIDEKKLIYKNSKKVKLMLTTKNRKILNTILMELLDEQRRANNFYCDLSHFEKMMQKFQKNKNFRQLANETMNYEKRFDKETVLEIFRQDEEKIMEYLKEMNDKDKYDEEEWKHIILKHKNMRILNRTNMSKNAMYGNLHKKHLVNKFKKEKNK